jgi:predicted dienelactone hydrolase
MHRLACAILIAVTMARCKTVAPLPPTGSFAPYAARGPFTVETGDAEWFDAARHVTVRAHLYYPTAPGRHPLILFSHGLGNSRFGYRSLGEHWAGWGFICVNLEHPGAGEDLARRGWLTAYLAGFDRSLWLTMPADVHFILDRLLSPDAPPSVQDRIDPDAIGIAGHSIGAYVALAAAGAIARLPLAYAAPPLRDPRIRAAVALSMSENLPADSYGHTDVPILHMTGTRDSSIFYGTRKRMRRKPFENITGAPQVLVTIAGASHGTFSSDSESPQTDLIKAATVLWWRAWLQNDEAARRAFTEASGELGNLATVRYRGAAAKPPP